MGEAPLMEKKSFIKEGEPQIASYSYTDIANGLGYITFYGAIQATSAGLTYALIDQPLASSPHLTTTDGIYALQHAAAAYTVNTNIFNTPRRLQGVAFVSCTLGIEGNTTSISMKVKVQHVRGAVVTDISSEITSQTFTTGSDIVFRRNVQVPIPLTTTNIKKGDIIRLLITNTGSSGAPRTTRIGFCPISTDANYLPFKLLLPFRIDL